MELTNPGYGNRAKDLADSAIAVQQAESALRSFNDDLSLESTSYAGLVLFAHEDSFASAAVTLDNSADHKAPDIHEFLHQNIRGRTVDLAATALGQYIKNGKGRPEYMGSLMNPGVHSTWNHTSLTERGLGGVIQLAYDMRFNKTLPSERLMDSIWNKHDEAIKFATKAILNLKRPYDPLRYTMELGLPVTPNSFLVRWDIVGSTELATGPHKVTFSKFIQEIRNLVNKLISSHEHSVAETGDGQNIAIFLPNSEMRSSMASVAQFGKSTVNPLVSQFISGYKEIAKSYPELEADIKLAVDLTNIDMQTSASGVSAFTSASYWLLADLFKKEKDSKQVLYTNAAEQALMMDGADRANLKR